MLLVQLSIAMLCSTLVLTESSNITVAVFNADPTLPFGLHRTGPAVDLGIRKLKEILGEDVKVDIVRYVSINESECEPDKQGLFGKIISEMHYERNITAIIGPTCSVATEFIGRLAAEWNHPMFPTSGSYPVLDNKDVFKTLTRLSYNSKGLSKFFVQFTSLFNWIDITIMHEPYGTRFTPQLYRFNTAWAENIHKNIKIAGVTSTLVQFSSETVDGLSKALKEASRTARVFLVICHSIVLREIMLKARVLGMTSGDYAFMNFFFFHGSINGEVRWKMEDKHDQAAREAFESLLLFGLYQSQEPEYQEFQLQIKQQSLKEYNFDYFHEDINPVALTYYEAFVLYGEIIAETIRDGKDYTDGKDIMSRMWNRTFIGINGEIYVNSNGDREFSWMVLDMNSSTGDFLRIGNSRASNTFHFDNSNTIQWPNDRGPPINKPTCGFSGENPECLVSTEDENQSTVLYVIIAFTLIVLILGFIILMTLRKMKRDAEMFSNWWKIPWEEISWSGNGQSRYSHLAFSESKLKSITDNVSIMNQNAATFKGTNVILLNLNANSLSVSKNVCVELNQLRNINCPNLTKFMGLTENNSTVYCVSELCPRGDLRDILSNDSFVLNREFSFSLMLDIIQAMEYIHTSNIRYHGSLRSQNCVIDSRFVLKVANFGLQSLRNFEIDPSDEKCFWIAPEVLRKEQLSDTEMQMADVYSFGITMYEVITRKEPYEDDKKFWSLKEILEKLKVVAGTQFRPSVDDIDFDMDVIRLMKNCWDEDPKYRPTFSALRKESRKMHWERSGAKLLDTLLSRMEQYANNLEEVVEERTRCLIEEKQKSEELLYQVLPRSVANELKCGRVVDPEAYTCVTIYFSDIVGFTNLSSESTPMQVINLLNGLYTCFDTIIEHFDVYKVETIGDAYMVVSGLPTRNGDLHVVEIAKMSCSILENVREFKVEHKPDYRLCARIGIHSGPVCAGVVGRKMPRYCLFGDTVNTASRMESNGEAMKIHVSESSQNLLKNHPDLLLEERGKIQIKGKGIMRTYWLHRRPQD